MKSSILRTTIRSPNRGEILLIAFILLWLFLFGCSEEEIHKVLKYAFCASQCTSSANWTKVTVDEAEEVGQHTSLSFDSEDQPSISYYDANNRDLKYAACTADCTTDSPTWLLTLVDEAGDVGRYASLKLDSTDNPRISYYDATQQDLRYAFFDGTQWNGVTVDSEGDVGPYTSLAIHEDSPRIAYYDRTKGVLKYATCEATDCLLPSDWTVAEVDQVGTIPTTVERAISLALDEDGNPSVAYYDIAGGSNLKYAFCKTACEQPESWVKSAADTSVNDVGQYPSLVLDSENRPLISYYDATVGDLKGVSCTGECDTVPVWSIPAVVDSLGIVGLFGSLVLDSSGTLQIGYYDVSFDALKYAFCIGTCANSANWTTMRVDSPGAGQFASLAVDSQNRPAISYWAEE